MTSVGGQANIGLYQDMLSDHDNLVYLRDTCPYTFLPVKFGAVAMAYPGNAPSQHAKCVLHASAA